MATYEYLNVDGNWNNTANWGGGPPASTDTALILQGDKAITTNMNQSAVNLAALVIGPKFRGSIGQPGDPLYIDATYIKVNSPESGEINIRPVSVDDFYVESCNVGANNLYIPQGTITRLHVAMAGLLRIGAATITDINAQRVSRDPRFGLNIRVGTGASIANIDAFNAMLTLMSTVTTKLRLVDSECDFQAESATLALLESYKSRFRWNGRSSTITLADLFAGSILDATEKDDARTLTNANVRASATLNLGGSQNRITVSNPVKKYGGRILGTNSVTTYIEEGYDSVGTIA